MNISVYADRPIFLKSIKPGVERHNAAYIAQTIFEAMEHGSGNDGINISERHFRSIVTDQPTVMTAAWRIVEEKKPWVHCYGCSAHILNLLAGDLRKIEYVSLVVEQNRQISNFFKSHTIARETLLQLTREKIGKPLSVILSCATRWSTDFFMLRRNLIIKSALVSSVVDAKLSKEMKANQEVKSFVLGVIHKVCTQKNGNFAPLPCCREYFPDPPP